MADRAQPQQRNLYTAEASQFRPDFRRTYGDDYMRTLSFVSTDTPAHARVPLLPTRAAVQRGLCNANGVLPSQGLGDVRKYDSLHPTNHMAKDLGRTGGAIVPRARAQREFLAQGSRGMVRGLPLLGAPHSFRVCLLVGVGVRAVIGAGGHLIHPLSPTVPLPRARPRASRTPSTWAATPSPIDALQNPGCRAHR